MIREAFQRVKQVGYVLVREGIKKTKVFLLRNKTIILASAGSG